MVNDETREVDAPFNMALATLKRLDLILIRIRTLDTVYSEDSPEKQKMYISLVKQFFINSVPLLDENYVKDNKTKILDWELKKSSRIKGGVQKVGYIYNSKLEKEVNSTLIEMQQKLSKYFMPKAKDLGSAVGNF